jgi:hypothetical protein
LTPLLTWNAATGAASDNLQISTVSTFSTLAINQSGLNTTSYPVGTGALNWNTCYYWRVQAVDIRGVTSAWATNRYFRTAAG